MGVQILDSLCDDEHLDCNDLLSSITGMQCHRNFFFLLLSVFSIKEK
jgi:hypothetical protein